MSAELDELISLKYLRDRIDARIRALRPTVAAQHLARMATEVDEQTGRPRTRFKRYVGGKAIGTWYFATTKGTPAHTDVVVRCYDWQRVMDDDNDQFAEWIAADVKAHIGELAERYVRETGDTLDGVAVEMVDVDEVPDAINPGGNLRVDRKNFEDVMLPRLGGYVAGLLGGAQQCTASG